MDSEATPYPWQQEVMNHLEKEVVGSLLYIYDGGNHNIGKTTIKVHARNTLKPDVYDTMWNEDTRVTFFTHELRDFKENGWNGKKAILELWHRTDLYTLMN